MATTNTLQKLHTLEQIKRAAAFAGSHWFDRSTLRYFRSRISETVYPVPGGALFVSSEKFCSPCAEDGQRLYTVRSCTADGRIDTVGDFQQWPSSREAHKEATRLLSSGFSLLDATSEAETSRWAARGPGAAIDHAWQALRPLC